MAKSARKAQCFALYRGDEFIDVGTIKELAERRGVSQTTIRFLASRSYHARSSYGALRAYRIEGLYEPACY